MAPSALSALDPSSFANSEDYLTTHVAFDWTIDFKREVIEGSVTLTIKNVSKKGEYLKLDSRKLDIKRVTVTGKEVHFTLTEGEVEALGACLSVPIGIEEELFVVTIEYATTKGCSALQWMAPGLTSGKKHPYLYSQCQAIHARSLFPCQDSPGVKATFSAQVRAPASLNVLMSAIKEAQVVTEGDCKVHTFHQKVPVPSYLVAVVCGNLEGRKIGPRSTVWSEPEMVEEAAREFSDTETFLATGEELCGPYVWGVYDILVLPPSFPYGGMENPCLTFVTPTLLVGDKSLVFVVAHEISHSWTGNLVTNATWEDFWLNEGHTRYLERLIMERYHGGCERTRHLLIESGIACLQESLNNYGRDHPFNQMVPRLEGADPDDSFSRVPYEKGSNLLFHLEAVVGKEKMLRWLRAYLDHFKYRSLTTEQWKQFLYEYLTGKEGVSLGTLEGVDWQGWFYGRGQIPVEHHLQRDLERETKTLADRWVTTGAASPEEEEALAKDYEALSADQRYYLLQVLNDILEATLPHDRLRLMGRLYGYTNTSNSELLFGWAMLTLRSRYEPALDQVLLFLNAQGRLKYTLPIYKALGGWPEMRQRAVANFQAVRADMHPITAAGVRKVLLQAE